MRRIAKAAVVLALLVGGMLAGGAAKRLPCTDDGCPGPGRTKVEYPRPAPCYGAWVGWCR